MKLKEMAETGVFIPASPMGSMLRQAGVMVAVAASVALGVAVVLWSRSPSYTLLYGDLADRDAITVLESLQGAGIEYKIEDSSGAIMVPAAKLHEARFRLASIGLPKGGNQGFEMLDEKQPFGTSQFLEKARYQRALEGELARSITALANVRNARVHLAIPKQSVFAREQDEPTASVLLELFPGRILDPGQVVAISHLVSSSVPNLPMSRVTVVDQTGRLLTDNESTESLAVTAKRFDYKSRVEESYSRRIEKILAPIVGMDGVRAQVTATIDFTETEQTSEMFNPDLPATRSEQVLEEQRVGSSEGGVPGALSNQPPDETAVPETAGEEEGAGTYAAQAQLPGETRKKSTRNFELDKTISHTRLPVGSLRRLSIAVVVNNPSEVDAQGNVSRREYTPPELERITNIVKEAIGFDAVRGDTVNIINTNFSEPPALEPLPETPMWERPWFWEVAKQVMGGLFVLFLVFGVLRPTLRSLLKPDAKVPEQALTDKSSGQKALASPGAEADLALRAQDAGSGTGGDGQREAKGKLKQLAAPSELESDLESVRSYVNDQPKIAAQVMKNWVGAD